jgi:hypothetical protein
VAQLKNCHLEVNTTIELKIFILELSRNSVTTKKNCQLGVNTTIELENIMLELSRYSVTTQKIAN